MNPLSKLSKSTFYKSIFNALTHGVSCDPQVDRPLCTLSEERPTQGIPLTPAVRIELSRGPADAQELKRILKQTFFLDEPSIKLFGLTGDEHSGELMDMMLQGISYKDSLVALSNDNDEMLGFALNGEYDKDKFHSEVEKWTSRVKEPRNKKLLALWSSMSREFDFKTIRPTAKAMEVFYLGVAPKARKQGLAKRLVKESLILAKFKGYGIVLVVCTNYMSARICQSLGMKEACSVEYKKLLVPLEETPDVTKPPPPPNENVKIYYHTT